MHPLIITALYPPAVGGAASHFGQIVPELLGRDDIDEVTVLTERMPGYSRDSVEGKLRVLRYLPTRISLGQRPWLIHAVTYVLTQSWFAARLPGLVRCRGASLVHFHTRYGGGPFYTSLKRCGVPVIADLHDKMTAPRELTGVADRLLSCGEGVRRFAVDGGFPANRVILIPIPFEPPPMPSPAQVGAARQRYRLGADPYLIFVGDITYNKGVYELLEGFRLWRSKHPEVRLVLAGTNREGERFLGQIGDRSEATYLGHIPHRDVLPLMRGAEVLVLPSRSEGLPRVILEALAVGTRVLCPPGIPEFERYLSHWVLPRVHADDIAEMLEPIWRDPQIPSYPFSEHRLDLVVEALAGIYGEVVTGESH